MKISLSLFGRFLVAALIIIFYILALVEWNWFDGMLKHFPIGAIVIVIVLGAFTSGFLKGRLPTWGAIKYSRDNFSKYTSAVIGYWVWIGIGAFLFGLALMGYANKM